MNANTKLNRVRELVRAKLLELRPFAGEEMDLMETDPRRDGFIEGERSLANQVLALIDQDWDHEIEPLEQEMVLGR